MADEWPKMWGPIKIYDAEFQVAWDMLLDRGFDFVAWDANTAVLEWQRLIRGKLDGEYHLRDSRRWYQWFLRPQTGVDTHNLFTSHYGWVRQGDTEILFKELQAELDGKKATWVEPFPRVEDRYALWSGGNRMVHGYPPWAVWFDCEARIFKAFGRTYEAVVQELAERKAREQPSTS